MIFSHRKNKKIQKNALCHAILLFLCFRLGIALSFVNYKTIKWLPVSDNGFLQKNCTLMKRSVLLFAVFTLLFSFTLPAQVNVTVADGAVTNSNIPIYGYYADNYLHEQVIYPASMLTSMNGQMISDITFYCSSTYIPSWTSIFNVSLGVTNVDTFASAAFIQTALTSLYTGVLTVSSEDNRMTIHFDTPFTYNGGNLLLDISSITKGSFSKKFHTIRNYNAL